jgi:serine O-acetyltransferase
MANTQVSVFRSFRNLCALVREDWERCERDWTQPGFRVVAVSRFGMWLREGLLPRPLRAPFWYLHRALYRYARNRYGIELPGSVVLGRRVKFGHQGGTVVHPNAVIGDDTIVLQNVTIGALVWERGGEAPKIGRNVRIGCGAAILGAVTIGDNVRIGPNCVVTTDVPDGATVFVNAPRMMLDMRRSAPPEPEPQMATAVNG